MSIDLFMSGTRPISPPVSSVLRYLLTSLMLEGVMSLFFYCHRTGYARTDSILNRLTRGCIQTGVFSAMLAVSGLVAFRECRVLHPSKFIRVLSVALSCSPSHWLVHDVHDSHWPDIHHG